MEKNLVLTFTTDANKTYSLSIAEPIEGLTKEVVLEHANRLVASQVMMPSAGQPVELKSAKYVERNVVEIF